MMIDVACPGCGKRFGWGGQFVDRPPCPRCGHTIPAAALEEMDRRARADEERRRTDPRCAAVEVLRQQRLDAGLSLRQAAKVMRIDPVWLSDVEAGRKPVPDELAERMIEAYGLEPRE